jgi:hypothetical protein
VQEVARESHEVSVDGIMFDGGKSQSARAEAGGNEEIPDRPLTAALVDPLLHTIEAYRLRWKAVQR